MGMPALGVRQQRLLQTAAARQGALGTGGRAAVEVETATRAVAVLGLWPHLTFPLFPRLGACACVCVCVWGGGAHDGASGRL